MIHRIAHLADFHLSNNLPWGQMIDCAFPSSPELDGQINSRQLEIYNALSYAIKKVDEYSCKTVVIAGDIYDYWKPDEKSRAIFAWFLRRLVELNCEVIVITGQHDVGNETGLLATQTLLKELAPKVFFYWGTDISSIIQNNQEYLLVPYQAFRQLKKDFANYSFRCTLAQGRYKNTIFVGHFPTCGIMLSSDSPLSDANWLSYEDYDLLLKSFKAVMLGDIHIRQMAYPGSLIRLDFGDMSPEKGFYIWEFDDDKAVAPNRLFINIPNSTEFIVVDESQIYEIHRDPVRTVQGKIVRAEATTTSRLAEVVKWCGEGGAKLVVPKLITKPIERVNKIQGMKGNRLDIKTAIIDFVDKTDNPILPSLSTCSISTRDEIIEAGMKYANKT